MAYGLRNEYNRFVKKLADGKKRNGYGIVFECHGCCGYVTEIEYVDGYDKDKNSDYGEDTVLFYGFCGFTLPKEKRNVLFAIVDKDTWKAHNKRCYRWFKEYNILEAF